jgi:hypothetical protein
MWGESLVFVHRRAGPAIEYDNGDKSWFVNNKLVAIQIQNYSIAYQSGNVVVNQQGPFPCPFEPSGLYPIPPVGPS